MKNKLMITAHRGCTEFGNHENTIAAIQKAIDIKCDAVEIDIRKTKDNFIILHHDDNILGKKIKDLNLFDLKKLSKSLNYEIALFEDVLLICKDRILVDIELKETGYEEEIVKLVRKYLKYNQFFIRSFNDKSIIKVKKYDKLIKTGLLLGVEKANIIKRLSEIFPLCRIIKTKCDFVAPHYLLIIFGFIKRMHLINKKVISWTVNNDKKIKKLINNKIDGLVSDYPSKVIKIYQDINK